MSPPSAIEPEPETNGHTQPSAKATHEPGLSESQAKVQMPKFPGPPTFTDKYKERDYLKGRLAAAFRIFGRFTDPVTSKIIQSGQFGLAYR